MPFKIIIGPAPKVFLVKEKRKGGIRHRKGVYYALVLTVRNLVNFKLNVKKQSNVNAP